VRAISPRGLLHEFCQKVVIDLRKHGSATSAMWFTCYTDRNKVVTVTTAAAVEAAELALKNFDTQLGVQYAGAVDVWRATSGRSSCRAWTIRWSHARSYIVPMRSSRSTSSGLARDTATVLRDLRPLPDRVSDRIPFSEKTTHSSVIIELHRIRGAHRSGPTWFGSGFAIRHHHRWPPSSCAARSTRSCWLRRCRLGSPSHRPGSQTCVPFDNGLEFVARAATA